MTRLWKARVQFEFNVLIAADEKPDELDFAEAAEIDLLDNSHTPWVDAATEICSPADIPHEWQGARPYGDTEHDTTEAVLVTRAHEQAAIVVDPRQRSLLGDEPEFSPAEVEEIQKHRALLEQTAGMSLKRKLSPHERSILHQLACAETDAVRRFYKELT